ncbi:MAG: hypothetical protein IH988_11575 [Planctomycetes bacterium]|nr:hypothetical protein [Planctomycetota bacterium]
MQCKWIKKLCRFVALAAAALAAGLTIPIQAANWHVDASVEDCGDGFFWTTAFRYLQDALNNPLLAEGDQIWVAQGIYFVDQDCLNPDGTGDRESTFQLERLVLLLGGFDGTETEAEQRDPLTNITILSGAMAQGPNPALCLVPGAPGGCLSGPCPSGVCEIDDCCRCRVCVYDPSCCTGPWDDLCHQLATKVCGGAYHVVTAGAEITDSFTTIIDGFTIQDGTAIGDGTGGGEPLQNQGGGMLITGEPSVIRCIFTNNFAGNARTRCKTMRIWGRTGLIFAADVTH